MADDADIADKEIETNLALDLALQRLRGTVVPPKDWDRVTCVDCEEQVTPVARLALGYCTCIACQQLREGASR